MFTADKPQKGVHPLACGKIMMRLIGKCNIDGKAKLSVRKACKNVQLCAGLQAGIEGKLHAMREVWLESTGWTFDSGTEECPTPEQYQAIKDGVTIPLAEGETLAGPNPLFPNDANPCLP